MKLLFVADLHYALKQFDWLMASASDFDAVIIGGDLLDLGSALDLDVQIVVIEKYLDKLRQKTRLLVSSGNHDGDGRSPANESVCAWLQAVRGDQLFVDGDSVEIGDTLITICPWWDGPVSRAELEQQLVRESSRVKSRWIWIHHSPPDKSPVSWAGKKFGGDEFLVEWIQRWQPELVLSGHIHNAPFIANGSWIDRLGKTWVFNPGKQIGPCPTFLVFDLDKMSVEWVSMEGQVMQQLNIPIGAEITSAGGADGA
ncbi:MAG TPA: metallophosphoesterase [Verrucomicrobiota bacterium]|nr:metallophosphoesterase [Verrucomicrobiota bacterium]